MGARSPHERDASVPHLEMYEARVAQAEEEGLPLRLKYPVVWGAAWWSRSGVCAIACANHTLGQLQKACKLLKGDSRPKWSYGRAGLVSEQACGHVSLATAQHATRSLFEFGLQEYTCIAF